MLKVKKERFRKSDMMRAYLDYNATAPLRPEAVEALARALALGGNPSSVHREGRAARAELETARDRIAALVNADPAGVIFTSGGTEANNLALAQTAGLGCRTILHSAIEHPAVSEPAAHQGLPVEILPVDNNGRLDLEAARTAIKAAAGPIFVSVMLANNETGTIQPVRELAHIVRQAGGILHVDAVQAAGRIAIDIKELGAHMLSLSSHKIGGPQGAGALILAEDRALDPHLKGGGQERRRRAGTENVAGLAGFGAAAEAVTAELGEQADRLRILRDKLEARLRDRAPDLRVFGAGAERIANTSCFAAPGLDAETLVMALDLDGVSVSSGAACSSGKVARSHVLSAMGVTEPLARGAIRASLGWQTSEQHIDRLVDAWTAARDRAIRHHNRRSQGAHIQDTHSMAVGK